MDTIEIDYISEADRERLEAHIRPRAYRVKTEPEHWIHGHDEGLSYCYTCAKSKVAELLSKEPNEDYCVDGGWGSEGDSLETCEICHVRLDNILTNYGCEAELDHFAAHGFNPMSDGDCYSLERMFSSRGWKPYLHEYMRDYERQDTLEYHRDFQRLCRAILEVIDNPSPRDEAKAARAERNAQRAWHAGRRNRSRYWWRVYHRWAHETAPFSN